MTRLANRFRCYAFDTPGFGGSFQPDAIPDLGQPAERPIEALDSLGFDRVHIC